MTTCSTVRTYATVSVSPLPLVRCFGGNFTLVEASVEGFDSDASLNAIYGRLGTSFGEIFSAELRLGTGISEDTVDSVDQKLKEFYGVYLRGGIPLGEKFYPYAIIGWTEGKVDFSGNGINESETESDVSFGAGVDFSFTETLKLNLEYISYVDKDIAELTGFSVGLAKSF